MGRNAASVLPAAVAAAMMTSWSAPKSAGIARSWASRREVQPSAHIQRWIRGSRRSKPTDSELEGGKLIVRIHLGIGLTASIRCNLHGTQQRPPISVRILLQHR